MNCRKIRLERTQDGWLEQRKLGIGGSDIAGIAGLSKYDSPLRVYNKKLNNYVVPDNFPMKLGRMQEEIVAQLFTETTGLAVRKSGYMYQDKDYDYMIANIDRLVQSKYCLLECKTASDYAASDWSDNAVPLAYMAQVQWYLGITGFSEAYIACLIGNHSLEVRHINRDEEFIKSLRNDAIDFWEKHILTQTPPAPIGIDIEDLCMRDVTDSAIELTCGDIFEKRFELKKERDILDAQIKALDAELLLELGNNAKGTCGKYSISCKPESRESIDRDILRSKYPEAYEACRKVTTTAPLRIKSK